MDNVENKKKVFNILSHDSRITIEEISKQTGLHRQTVNRIIDSLRKDSKIWGYCTAPCFDMDEQQVFCLMLKQKKDRTLSNIFKEYLDKTSIEEIVDMPIIFSGLFHGSYGCVIVFVADNLHDAILVVDKIIHNTSKFIDDYDLLHGLHTIRVAGFLNPNLKYKDK